MKYTLVQLQEKFPGPWRDQDLFFTLKLKTEGSIIYFPEEDIFWLTNQKQITPTDNIKEVERYYKVHFVFGIFK